MKKLFISLSNKGGVGKSMLSKTLVELFREQYGDRVEAYDCDFENHGLANIYGLKDNHGNIIPDQDASKGVALLDIREGRGRDEMLNVLARAEKSEVVIFDMPANNVSTFEKIIENAETYIMAAEELGFEIYIFNLVSSDIESLYSLQDCYSMFGNDVNYIVVFNNAFLKQDGNNMRQIYNGDIKVEGFTFNRRNVAKTSKGLFEIELHELHPELNNYLKEHRVTFGDFMQDFSKLEAKEKTLGVADNHRIVTFANKLRLKGFLDKMRKEIVDLI